MRMRISERRFLELKEAASNRQHLIEAAEQRARVEREMREETESDARWLADRVAALEAEIASLKAAPDPERKEGV